MAVAGSPVLLRVQALLCCMNVLTASHRTGPLGTMWIGNRQVAHCNPLLGA